MKRHKFVFLSVFGNKKTNSGKIGSRQFLEKISRKPPHGSRFLQVGPNLRTPTHANPGGDSTPAWGALLGPPGGALRSAWGSSSGRWGGAFFFPVGGQLTLEKRSNLPCKFPPKEVVFYIAPRCVWVRIRGAISLEKTVRLGQDFTTRERPPSALRSAPRAPKRAPPGGRPGGTGTRGPACQLVNDSQEEPRP